MTSFADDTITAYGVTLRALHESDVPQIATACNDPITQRWLPLPQPYTEDSARYFVSELASQSLTSGGGIERAIEVGGVFSGVIGFKNTDWQVGSTEVGYWVAPWAREQRVATRALAAMTNWALDSQGLQRVCLHAATGNAASQATARAALFIEEGVLRQAGYTHSGLVDLVVFSRLRSDPRPEL